MHTVLLFDSDSRHRRRTARLLVKKGYRVVSHENPQDLWKHGKIPARSCILHEIVCHEGNDGVELLAEMRCRDWRIPVVFMAAECHIPQIVRVMRAGALGVVGKSDDAKELVSTLEDALARTRQVEKMEKAFHDAAAKVKLLSKRELEVVKAAAIGIKNEDIAGHLGLAVITVKGHRARAMRKLEAGNIVHLARIAYMAGLVDPILMEEFAGPLHDIHNKTPHKTPRSRPRAGKPGARKKP